VGGGLAGCAAALELLDGGHDVTLLEARPTLGGAVQTLPAREGDPARDGDPVRAESDALYVSFRIPSNAPPGERPGLLQVRAGGQTAEIAVKLTIHKATVPEQGHLRVTNWFSTVHMARLHKVEPWSEAHWDMIHQYALMMRRGRQTDFMPIGPEEKKSGEGQWKFDFTRTERMIRMFLGAGFTHIELPHVARHDRHPRRDGRRRDVR
jgi:choline dehydrogenase-like flavoprotein